MIRRLWGFKIGKSEQIEKRIVLGEDVTLDETQTWVKMWRLVIRKRGWGCNAGSQVGFPRSAGRLSFMLRQSWAPEGAVGPSERLLVWTKMMENAYKQKGVVLHQPNDLFIAVRRDLTVFHDMHNNDEKCIQKKVMFLPQPNFIFVCWIRKLEVIENVTLDKDDPCSPECRKNDDASTHTTASVFDFTS